MIWYDLNDVKTKALNHLPNARLGMFSVTSYLDRLMFFVRIWGEDN